MLKFLLRLARNKALKSEDEYWRPAYFIVRAICAAHLLLATRKSKVSIELDLLHRSTFKIKISDSIWREHSSRCVSRHDFLNEESTCFIGILL